MAEYVFRWACPRCGSYAESDQHYRDAVTRFGQAHRCVMTGIPPVRPPHRQRRRQLIAGSRRVGGVA